MGSGNWEQDMLFHFYFLLSANPILLCVWPLIPQPKSTPLSIKTIMDFITVLLIKYRYLSILENISHQRWPTSLFSFFQKPRIYELFQTIYRGICKQLLNSIMPTVLKWKEFIKFHQISHCIKLLFSMNIYQISQKYI